ncbi:MAG: hypothetical protein RL514_2010 [Verrucomicrobiota bacterium]|jgi:hypothetical protein
MERLIPYAELEAFFTGLVRTAQSRGITCAITSGMACVHFGVAATTKDCDVLCAVGQAEEFRALVAETELRGLRPNYRGNISPPLDARWMRGGWTAHFTWKTEPEEYCLDVFGTAPRASSVWEQELHDLYASRHTVAEMKLTNRPKDWPYVTALGIKLLGMGDVRGCLHLYSAETLLKTVRSQPIPAWMFEIRPTLELARTGDDQLAAAIHAEQVFWSHLDACRIRVYEQSLRPYVNAVRKAIAHRPISLAESHAIRIECAERHLVKSPLVAHGFDQLVQAARAETAKFAHPSLMEWLPKATVHFTGIL